MFVFVLSLLTRYRRLTSLVFIAKNALKGDELLVQTDRDDIWTVIGWFYGWPFSYPVGKAMRLHDHYKIQVYKPNVGLKI